MEGRPVPLRIRRGMDVFSAYQDQYIGSVHRVWHRDQGPQPDQVTGPAAEQAPPFPHEEGNRESSTAHMAQPTLGEELGPFPTIAAGNTGPIAQSRSHDYATEGPQPEVVLFAVRPGRVTLGPLSGLLYIPTSAVRSISMERIVIDVEKSAIPRAWRQRPGSV